MPKVISVEHLTKKYDLGVIGTGTLTRDVERWWARMRQKPDPYSIIGQRDNFSRIGESILAMDDVSFSVQQGETLGIIGRNGAGKSTLLKILSRVTAPTSGLVKVKGRIGSLLEVGTGFHPDLTGRENVYLNGAILGMKKAEVARKFDEIVAFSGVEKFIDTPVKRYSSGMYVRLAFAVAAHLDPEILIVDEVLAVGDSEFQKKCLGKMGDVANEGRTVLFVSHNMGSIMQLCNEGMLLDAGKIVILGEVGNCINTYLRSNENSYLIVNNGHTLTEDIIISTVHANGIASNEIMIMPNERFLEVRLTGEAYKSLQLSLEVKLLDTNGTPLAYFSPAHFNEKYTKTDQRIFGKFELSGHIELPIFTKGDYFLDIYLTEPCVRGLWESRNGVHITTESQGMVTQHNVLEQRRGFGSLILQGNYSVKKIQ